MAPSQNTDAKLLIYRLFQEGRVLAQDGNAINRSILDFLAEIPEERKLQVNFEGFFEQASSELRSVFLRFVGADDLTLADAEEFFKTRINIKKVRQEFPDPPKWNDSMQATLEHYCGDTMRQLGYTREQGFQAR